MRYGGVGRIGAGALDAPELLASGCIKRKELAGSTHSIVADVHDPVGNGWFNTNVPRREVPHLLAGGGVEREH